MVLHVVVPTPLSFAPHSSSLLYLQCCTDSTDCYGSFLPCGLVWRGLLLLLCCLFSVSFLTNLLGKMNKCLQHAGTKRIKWAVWLKKPQSNSAPETSSRKNTTLLENQTEFALPDIKGCEFLFWHVITFHYALLPYWMLTCITNGSRGSKTGILAMKMSLIFSLWRLLKWDP